MVDFCFRYAEEACHVTACGHFFRLLEWHAAFFSTDKSCCTIVRCYEIRLPAKKKREGKGGYCVVIRVCNK